MGQFGQDLRQERESRGVALESISGITKISGRHLTALEQENFSALPGGVLNKGIVRGYARACGMDENAWVERYLAAYHQSGQIKDDDQAWIEFAENVGTSHQREEGIEPDTKLRWAGVSVLMIVLAFFTWYVVHFVSMKSAAFPAATAPAAQIDAGGSGSQ